MLQGLIVFYLLSRFYLKFQISKKNLIQKLSKAFYFVLNRMVNVTWNLWERGKYFCVVEKYWPLY